MPESFHRRRPHPWHGLEPGPEPPTLYGFVPRTFCDAAVAARMPDAIRGDGDPLDVRVVSERAIARAEVLLTARVIGGIPMLDGGESDDKAHTSSRNAITPSPNRLQPSTLCSLFATTRDNRHRVFGSVSRHGRSRGTSGRTPSR